MGDYSLRDAELLADSPFVDAFFGMQPHTNRKLRIHHLNNYLQIVN